MIGFLGTILVIVAILGVIAVGVGAAMFFGGKKVEGKVEENYARNNQVVPGIASAAPTSWLGSHDPEAKLHRRLIDAIKALHANQNFDTVGQYLDLRVDLEQQAVAIDNELVATAALPANLRQEPLTRLAESVAAIEGAVAELGRAATSGASGSLDQVLQRVKDRTNSVGQAQQALDALEQSDPLPPTPAPAPAPEQQPGTTPPS